MKNPILFLLLTIACLAFACRPNSNQKAEAKTEAATSSGLSISKEFYGPTDQGPGVLYTLKNKNDVTVEITNYGGIIVSIIVPDKNGKLEDVVLGFDSLPPNTGSHPYFGALIGRYGNRIAGGKFTIDDQTYALATNNGPNHLHGGVKGFDKILWNSAEVEKDDVVGVRLTLKSKDREEGYPGNLDVTVLYTLNNADELQIDYVASTDKKTHCNLTNHTYFNLTGNAKSDVSGHEVMIKANQYTPVDATLIPTGQLADVTGTPFDFTKPMAVGARINADHQQIEYGGGYDHNFVLARKGDGLELAATVYEPTSGRFLEVFTEEPGVQFYTGNFLDGSLTGKNGRVYYKRYGFCLETQHFPNSPNEPDFPSTLLEPGERYETSTMYRFSTK